MERVIYFDYLTSQKFVEEHSGIIGSDSVNGEALLSWLEEQLGIIPFEPERRLFAFYRILAQHITPNDSIYESFDKNPIGTVRVMMSWFDGLTLIGWRGELLDDNRLARFNILSALYSRICDSVAGRSDALRIEQCIEYLLEKKLQLNRLALAQPVHLLPNAWQELLNAIITQGVSVSESATSEDEASNKDESPTKVTLLSAAGVIDASHIASQYLSLNASNAESALIVSQYGTSIDHALSGCQQPSVGFKDTSNARLVTQIIPALLNGLSGQYSIESMVVLLCHRLWGGDTALSKKLASKMVSNLGIGNDEWEDAKAELLEKTPEVVTWLDALEQRHSDSGLLKTVVNEVRLKALKTPQPLYREFARQCQLIIDVLSTPVAELKQSQRTKILKELGVGQLPTIEPLAMVSPEMHCHGLQQPGYLRTKPNTTIWVGPYYEPQYTLPDWYQPELDALSEHYDVFTRADDLALLRSSWNQFLEQVKEHLVIIDFDSSVKTHPLFDELAKMYNLRHESWADYLTEQTSGAVKTEYETNLLPAYARVARVNNSISLGEKMSASRLEKLLFKTSDFVFNYGAKLRDYSIELPQIGNRERGLYAHALFERYFKEHPTADTWNNIEDWEAQHADDIFKQEALVFLEPGAYYDKQAIKQQSLKALQQLVATFAQSNVAKVTPELDVEGWQLRVGGYGFAAIGKLDLVLEKADGSVMILDAKWANSQEQYTKALENGFSTQLYTYAAMYSQMHNKWPEVGYFIIKDGAFLVNDTTFLKGESTHLLTYKFDSAAEAWQMIDELATWRFEQLKQGTIELNNPGCEMIEGVSYPEDETLRALIKAYRTHYTKRNDSISDKYSDYRHLIGWRDVSAE